MDGTCCYRSIPHSEESELEVFDHAENRNQFTRHANSLSLAGNMDSGTKTRALTVENKAPSQFHSLSLLKAGF